MKRIFIAVRVEPEEKLRELLFLLRGSLASESIKWTDPENIHITLAFLGDTGDEKIREIIQMLQDVSASFGKFGFLLRGVGVFRSISSPRIIWVGATHSEELSRLNGVISDGLRKLQCPVEEREFRPHLTVGRIKSLRNSEILRSLIEKYRNTEIQKVPVTEVILFESIPGGRSAIYKPVYSARLS